MPIEIKELHIKAIVATEQAHSGPAAEIANITKLKKEISEDVLRKVLRQLKQKNER
ncbi:DUF5908 family protein [Parapedobacter soli]|uniref:DUF5908 family protein n=1 Tax=Parapedobacter soli TaxID=416955 RepID=UPI0021C580FA|nr:DUF5908 family protein [Parapedobacter soli]